MKTSEKFSENLRTARNFVLKLMMGQYFLTTIVTLCISHFTQIRIVDHFENLLAFNIIGLVLSPFVPPNHLFLVGWGFSCWWGYASYSNLARYNLLFIILRCQLLLRENRKSVVYSVIGVTFTLFLCVLYRGEWYDVREPSDDIKASVLNIWIHFELFCVCYFFNKFKQSEVRIIDEVKQNEILKRDGSSRFILLLSHITKNLFSGILPPLLLVQRLKMRKILEFSSGLSQDYLDLSLATARTSYRTMFNLLTLEVFRSKFTEFDTSPSRFSLTMFLQYVCEDLPRHASHLSRLRLSLVQEDCHFPRFVKGDRLIIGRVVENLVFGLVEMTNKRKKSYEVEDIVGELSYDKIKQELIMELVAMRIVLAEDENAEEKKNEKKKNEEDFESPERENDDEEVYGDEKGEKVEDLPVPLQVSQKVLCHLGGTFEMWDRADGKTVRVTVPLPESFEDPYVREYCSGMMSEGQRPLNILVLEDNPICRRFIRKYINECGKEEDINHHIMEVDNGEEGYGVLRSGFQPDLIFSDFDMPYWNGEYFAREVKKKRLLEHEWCDIYLLTGATFSEERKQNFLSTNLFKEVISKPLRMDKVRSVIGQASSKRNRMIYLRMQKLKKEKENQEKDDDEEEEEEEIEGEGEDEDDEKKEKEEKGEAIETSSFDDSDVIDNDNEESNIEVVNLEEGGEEEEEEEEEEERMKRTFFGEVKNSVKKRWDENFFFTLMPMYVILVFLAGYRSIPLLMIYSVISVAIVDPIMSYVWDGGELETISNVVRRGIIGSFVLSPHVRRGIPFSIVEGYSRIEVFRLPFFLGFFLVGFVFELVMMCLAVKPLIGFNLIDEYGIVSVLDIGVSVTCIYAVMSSFWRYSDVDEERKEFLRSLIEEEYHLVDLINDSARTIRKPFFLLQHYSKRLYDEIAPKLVHEQSESFLYFFQSLMIFRKDTNNLLLLDEYDSSSITRNVSNVFYFPIPIRKVIQEIVEEETRPFRGIDGITFDINYNFSLSSKKKEEEEEEELEEEEEEELENLYVEINPYALEMILSNLIQNAIYSVQFVRDMRKITIDVSIVGLDRFDDKYGGTRVDDTIPKYELNVIVRDTGIGMNGEVYERSSYNTRNESENGDFEILCERSVKTGEETGNPKLGIGLMCCEKLISEYIHGISSNRHATMSSRCVTPHLTSLRISDDKEQGGGTKAVFRCELPNKNDIEPNVVMLYEQQFLRHRITNKMKEASTQDNNIKRKFDGFKNITVAMICFGDDIIGPRSTKEMLVHDFGVVERNIFIEESPQKRRKLLRYLSSSTIDICFIGEEAKENLEIDEIRFFIQNVLL